MNLRHLIYPLTVAVFTLAGGNALAQEIDDLDVTMNLVEEGEELANVMEPIVLPNFAAPQGVENSAFGLASANDARNQGREFGQGRAEEARLRGEEARTAAADNAEEALTRARQNVKDRIPADGLENIPDNILDNIPTDVRDRIPGRGRPGG